MTDHKDTERLLRNKIIEECATFCDEIAGDNNCSQKGFVRGDAMRECAQAIRALSSPASKESALPPGGQGTWSTSVPAPQTGLPEEPDVIGILGAVPSPTLADAVRVVADYISLDATEEAAQEAAVLRQAAEALDQKARECEEWMARAIAAESALLRDSHAAARGEGAKA